METGGENIADELAEPGMELLVAEPVVGIG